MTQRHFHTRNETIDTRARLGIDEALYKCHCGHVIGWRRARNT